jgi:hypothetical protein
LNLEYLELAMKLTLKTKIKMKEETVIQVIKDKFRKFIWSNHQEVVVEIKDLGIVFLKVEGLDVFDIGGVDEGKGADIVMFEDRGVIFKHTRVKVLPDQTFKNLEWIPNPDPVEPMRDITKVDKEFIMIVRRAFASRSFSQTDIKRLGLKNVQGMLLYRPPGTGKEGTWRSVSIAFDHFR